MADRYVLDANIFIAILRREPGVAHRVNQALAGEAEFLLCPAVFYEVYRGLLYRDARKQADFFLSYTATFVWNDFDEADWQQAAQWWADLRHQGHQAADADLLIGVYALRRQAILITDNEKDFTPLGVQIENWR